MRFHARTAALTVRRIILFDNSIPRMRSFRNERVTAMRSLPTRGGSVQSSIYLSTCLPAHLLTYSRKSIRAICPVCAVLRVSPCSTRSLARREYRDVISRNYINGYGRYSR